MLEDQTETIRKLKEVNIYHIVQIGQVPLFCNVSN